MAKYPKGKMHGKTEYDENGHIVAFHKPVKRFKRVITEKQIKGVPKGFEIRIQIRLLPDFSEIIVKAPSGHSA